MVIHYNCLVRKECGVSCEALTQPAYLGGDVGSGASGRVVGRGSAGRYPSCPSAWPARCSPLTASGCAEPWKPPGWRCREVGTEPRCSLWVPARGPPQASGTR